MVIENKDDFLGTAKRVFENSYVEVEWLERNGSALLTHQNIFTGKLICSIRNPLNARVTKKTNQLSLDLPGNFIIPALPADEYFSNFA